MQTEIVLQGRIVGPTTIELDEPVSQTIGAVEVVVRQPAPRLQEDLSRVDFIMNLPPGTRTKEDIDAQIEDERNSWER